MSTNPTPRRYRLHQVEAEAVQWTGENIAEVRSFVGSARILDCDVLAIPTPDGDLWIRRGSYVIRDNKGELHECYSTDFTATYTPADEPTDGERLDKLEEFLKEEHAAGFEPRVCYCEEVVPEEPEFVIQSFDHMGLSDQQLGPTLRAAIDKLPPTKEPNSE